MNRRAFLTTLTGATVAAAAPMPAVTPVPCAHPTVSARVIDVTPLVPWNGWRHKVVCKSICADCHAILFDASPELRTKFGSAVEGLLHAENPCEHPGLSPSITDITSHDTALGFSRFLIHDLRCEHCGIGSSARVGQIIRRSRKGPLDEFGLIDHF